MNKTIKTLLVAAAAAAAVLVMAKGFQAPSAAPAIGSAAPAFSLPSSDGKTVSLGDFKDKVVILEWWNHECPFVVAHYSSGNMQRLQKWAKDKGIVWLTVLSSAPGKQGYVDAAGAQALHKKHGMHSQILLDPAGNTGKAYGARTTPHMYVINKGSLVYNGAIDDRNRDQAKAKNFVVAAVEDVMAGRPVATATTQPYGCSVKYP